MKSTRETTAHVIESISLHQQWLSTMQIDLDDLELMLSRRVEKVGHDVIDGLHGDQRRSPLEVRVSRVEEVAIGTGDVAALCDLQNNFQPPRDHGRLCRVFYGA
jgi:hypothetical protein